MRMLAAATAGLRRLLDVLLISLIVIVLLGILLAKLVPLTGRQTIIVGGSSMEPAIALGAAIVIQPVPADALGVGDVVTLKAGDKGAIFTHRIIDVVDRADGRWIRTKGDANAAPDPTLVHSTAVIGRSEFSIPLAGYLLALLSIPTGILFLIGLAASLLAGAWLLESLELERADRVRVTFLPSMDRTSGEPIAVRPVPAPPRAADVLVGPDVRLSPAEKLALARAARLGRQPVPGTLRRAQRRAR